MNTRYFYSGFIKSDYGRKYYPVVVPRPVFCVFENDDDDTHIEYYTRWGLEIIYWAKKK